MKKDNNTAELVYSTKASKEKIKLLKDKALRDKVENSLELKTDKIILK